MRQHLRSSSDSIKTQILQLEKLFLSNNAIQQFFENSKALFI
jgi:hypothetical protein